MRRLSWIMQKALNAATCTEERKGDLTHIEKKIHMRMIQRSFAPVKKHQWGKQKQLNLLIRTMEISEGPFQLAKIISNFSFYTYFIISLSEATWGLVVPLEGAIKQTGPGSLSTEAELLAIPIFTPLSLPPSCTIPYLKAHGHPA